MGKQYDRREMEEILRRALAKDEGDAVAHEDLVAAAAEVGLSPEAIEEAAKGLREDKVRLVKRAQLMEHARQGFFRHLASYLTVNGGLLALNLIGGGPLWSQFPIIGWGIFLAMHAVRTFMPNERRMERRINKAIQRDARRKRLAQPYSPNERSRRSKQRAEKLQRLVDDGIDMVLGQVAEQLERQRSGGPRMRVEPTLHDDRDDTDHDYRRRSRK